MGGPDSKRTSDIPPEDLRPADRGHPGREAFEERPAVRTSPEIPGEDRYIKDRERIKTEPSSRSRRRQGSSGRTQRRQGGSRSDELAKRKAQEQAEAYNYSHRSRRGEEKRSKRDLPRTLSRESKGRKDPAYSRRDTEDQRKS